MKYNKLIVILILFLVGASSIVSAIFIYRYVTTPHFPNRETRELYQVYKPSQTSTYAVTGSQHTQYVLHPSTQQQTAYRRTSSNYNMPSAGSAYTMYLTSNASIKSIGAGAAGASHAASGRRSGGSSASNTTPSFGGTSIAVVPIAHTDHNGVLSRNAHSGFQTVASTVTGGVTTAGQPRAVKEGTMGGIHTPGVPDVQTPVGDGVGILLLLTAITGVISYLKRKKETSLKATKPNQK